MLAVDALSTVLTKNPHLKWKASDTSFLRSFQELYRPADDESDLSDFDTVVEYAVPDYLNDPIMLLVLFRQNICGSTFFHRLQEAYVEMSPSQTMIPSQSSNATRQMDNDKDTMVPFDPREFTLFYNNAPSPLDPEFQPVCTLTSKGAEYSRKTGTGIAVIDVTLIDRDGQTVQALNVGQTPTEMDISSTSLRLERMENCSEPPSRDKMHEYRIRVHIADTALDREALHGWVELTFNQVLIAWVIERHIERAQLGLLRHSPAQNAEEITCQSASFSNKEQRMMIDSLEPGFPLLFDILDGSHDLPHPAVEKLELGGVIKASSVASVALSMLEKCLNGLGLVRKESQHSLESQVQELSGTTIIRLSRTRPPTPVNLFWDSSRNSARAMMLESNNKSSNVQDSPIDCPEYLCVYCFNHYSSDEECKATTLSPSSMCFREVMVDDKSDGKKGVPFVDALLSLRERDPSSFSRSLLFVLSVKRNRRMLMTYNWNPKDVKR